MELHEGKREGYPSIKTLVTLGKEDLSIKVSAKKIRSYAVYQPAMSNNPKLVI